MGDFKDGAYMLYVRVVVWIYFVIATIFTGIKIAKLDVPFDVSFWHLILIFSCWGLVLGGTISGFLFKGVVKFTRLLRKKD
ncbi:MAG: hypothetical protein ACOCXG_04505 [Nanoarchaeota archaeon]